MIKTTSFASVRPGKTLSNPSSKVAARQNAIKAAKARSAAAQPTLFGLFDDPTTSAPEISASQARERMQSAAPKSKTKTAPPAQSAPVQSAPVAASPTKVKFATPVEVALVDTPPTKAKTALTIEAPQPKAKTVAPVAMTSTETETAPVKKNTRAAKTKTATPVATPVAANIETPVAPEAVAPKIEVAPASVEAVAPPKQKKTKRARVPENLAEQYGQNLSKRVEGGIEAVPVEDETPKKRRSRAETQARRELMKPDSDLIARLQRAQNAIPTRKPEKRPVGWRFDCGRCGHTSYFQTSGALCSCGALAIKE